MTDDSAPCRAAEIAAPDATRRGPVSAHFAADVASGAKARRFIAGICGSWGIPDVMPDAELVTTELVENAVRHGRIDCSVTVEMIDAGLFIAVHDWSQARPRRVRSAATEAGGRGLLLIERLSDDWGFAADDAGKTVWALLALPERRNGPPVARPRQEATAASAWTSRDRRRGQD